MLTVAPELLLRSLYILYPHMGELVREGWVGIVYQQFMSFIIQKTFLMPHDMVSTTICLVVEAVSRRAVCGCVIYPYPGIAPG